MKGRRSTVPVVCAIAAIVTGCGDGDASLPRVTPPPELDACADPQTADVEAACLDQIERFVETDIAGVEDALQQINDMFSRASSASMEFERVTPLREGGDPVPLTEPLEWRWRVGTTERTMFVCVDDGVIEVGQSPCAD